MKDQNQGVESVLRFVARRWPSDGDLAVLIRKAAKTRGLSVSLADYLRTLSRRHEMIARALRLAARAADGEDVNALIEVPIDRDERIKIEDRYVAAADAHRAASRAAGDEELSDR